MKDGGDGAGTSSVVGTFPRLKTHTRERTAREDTEHVRDLPIAFLVPDASRGGRARRVAGGVAGGRKSENPRVREK